MMSILEAKSQGYSVEWNGAGRPIAFKGPRYSMTDFKNVLTEEEVALLGALQQAEYWLNNLGETNKANYFRDMIELMKRK